MVLSCLAPATELPDFLRHPARQYYDQRKIYLSLYLSVLNILYSRLRHTKQDMRRSVFLVARFGCA